MHGNNIEVVDDLTYLGITLENTDNWKKHKKKLREVVIRL
jgi:hypothetical protein